MSGLFGSLSMAMRALLAQQDGLQVTSNNNANVNTPGYSRQRALLRETPPAPIGNVQLGSGVSLDRIESVRDRILELRIHQETQHQGELEAFLGAARQIETIFNETQGAGLEGALSAFFNSLQRLQADPVSLPLRQGVLTAGQNLAAAFNRSARSLASQRLSLDREVARTAAQINQLTAEITVLNREVTAPVGVGLDPGEWADRRELLIRELSSLVDLAVIDAGKGSRTITASGGTALVVGGQSIPVQSQADPATGLQHIFSPGSDITASITAGKLGGLLSARDQTIPNLLTDLDSLAVGWITAFNTQHRAGFDLNGVAGVDFFTPPASGPGAAQNLAIALTNPALLAASSDGIPGSARNLALLTERRAQAVVSGQNPFDFYAGVVFRLGSDIASAAAELEAEGLVLAQLENQRGALSAVSLDEEAANLLRFQRAFEAAARVVSVVDELTQTAINLGRI